MRTLMWVALGWLATTLCAAFAARLSPGHVAPEVPAIVVVFLALRRAPVPLVAAALLLGFFCGTGSLAPPGLWSLALGLVAVVAYLAAGSLTGGGALFFAAAAAAAAMALHALLFVLLYWQRGRAGFASVAAATLLPTGAVTFVPALLAFGPMRWLDRRLGRRPRPGLTWH